MPGSGGEGEERVVEGFGAVAAALRSVVAITVTPFDGGDRIDEKAYVSVVERMVAGGVRAVTPNGNTSEFYALTPEELDRAVALTVEAVNGTAMVVPGVGYDVVRAADMARAARRHGAQAVMVHQPVHPFQSTDGWIAYHRAVADAVPELGVVCYVRSPLVPPAAYAALADACPNFVGVKYAVPDVLALADAVAAVPDTRLAWVCGLAETWAPFFWLSGARGFTSGLANVAPELAVQLWRHLDTGDQGAAMRLWSMLKPIEDLRAQRGSADNVSVVKEALAQLGLCGRAVRPPITELVPADRVEVARIIGAWGAAATAA
jgi:4-hydroxy-tetrahydrodipicolinate synthase